MAVNQQQKHAVKRLMKDLAELRNSPVASISAAPLDGNMLEWHCNIADEDCIYHIILFFPEEYPCKSPSAEFVPKGFEFFAGATKDGKKGTQVCLSIFSDFATYHKEWADDKATGWSPGYTVQTVLLNLIAFLAEGKSEQDEPGYYRASSERRNASNLALCKGFTCKDCGHTYKKPFPPLDMEAEKGEEQGNKTQEASTDMPSGEKDGEIKNEPPVQMICYISKEQFLLKDTYTEPELFGYGIMKSGTGKRVSFTTPCELVTSDAFFSMQTTMGKVESILREDIHFFLPLHIHPNHGAHIQQKFEECLKAMAVALPDCNPEKASFETIILKTVPNLMNATVVEFSNGNQHTSDNHLTGYFALHRLFLWSLHVYPNLQEKVEAMLQGFIENEKKRDKKYCPNLGILLAVLSGSLKYKWHDIADAFLSECFKRNVMWYIKDYADLGNLTLDMESRIGQTFTATATSRKLVSFQVLFLDIAMPRKMSREDVLKRYDDNFGFPTNDMIAEMKKSCVLVEAMKSFEDWFKIMSLKTMKNEDIFKILLNDVEFSISTPGYKWTGSTDKGGWSKLTKYVGGTPNFKAGTVWKGSSGFVVVEEGDREETKMDT